MRSGSSKNFGCASGGSSILAEFGTMHMEFAYLSDITGNPVYRQKVERVREVLAEGALELDIAHHDPPCLPRRARGPGSE